MNEIETLRAYASGSISRGHAMQALGLDWYGDLLVLLNRHGIERPRVSEADARAMDEVVRRVLG